MFESISQLPDDPILKLSQLFKEDSRVQKVDVGVGIFQDEQGATPVLRAVKAAEKHLLDTEDSKKYVGVMGNTTFNQAMIDLVLGNSVEASRVRAIQATAGTGAVRLMGEVLHALVPTKRLHVSNPTWGNHHAIFQAAGFKAENYPYYDHEKSIVNREAFFQALENFGQDDLVLLHGCCHNPSGADLSREDWDKVAEIAVRKGWLPLVDLAYLGFGESLEADAYGVRKLASSVETLLIAVSGSKNFGLYRERVGCVIMVGKNEPTVSALASHFAAASRAMVSMPPSHGASIVAQILTTPSLRTDWEQELQAMCGYIHLRRQQLQSALEQHAGGDWKFITDVHRGMFTLLNLGTERVQRLREEFAIYMVGTGRINIAGMKSQADVEYVAQAVAKVL